MVRLLDERERRRVWGQREESGVKDRASARPRSGDGGHDFFCRRAAFRDEARTPDRLKKWWGPVVLEVRLLPLSFYPMSSEQKSSGGAGSMPATPEFLDVVRVRAVVAAVPNRQRQRKLASLLLTATNRSLPTRSIGDKSGL